MEKVIGTSSSRKRFVRETLNPISSMIRAIRGLKIEFSSGSGKAKALVKLGSPRRVPTRKAILLDRNFLLSIILIFSPGFSHMNRVILSDGDKMRIAGIFCFIQSVAVNVKKKYNILCKWPKFGRKFFTPNLGKC